MSKIRLIQGDCLEVMDKLIEEGVKVDAIICDPPYGNMNTDGGRKLGINEWDIAINPIDIHNRANKLLRKNGKMLLFSQEPYTRRLINNSVPNTPFLYRAIWEKDNFANALGVNKTMVSFTEDILIFSKKEDVLTNPIKSYTNKIRSFIDKPNKKIFRDFETNGFRKYAVLDTFNSENARRYNFPTEETYNNLIYLYHIENMDGFLKYNEARKKHDNFKNKTLSTFNLWEGKKFKSNILKYKKDYNGYHPTQKPVLLMEDLIKTYTNEGDLVLDFTMGSSSTGVACARTNRNFIGIELDKGYFKIATERIENEGNQMSLF